MTLQFGAELAYADREISRIRNAIAHADVTALSATPTIRESSAASRAHAYVWLAATLERVTGDSVRTTLRAITSAAIPQLKMRTSLFALLCDPELTSIADRNRQLGWPMRVALFDRLIQSTPAALSDDVVPLDGRTLRAEHFDTLWGVFGLPGSSLPGAIHRVSLKDLATGRNNVAHGHQDPILFGKTKSAADLFNLIKRVDEIIVHTLTAFDDYLAKAKYLR